MNVLWNRNGWALSATELKLCI